MMVCWLCSSAHIHTDTAVITDQTNDIHVPPLLTLSLIRDIGNEGHLYWQVHPLSIYYTVYFYLIYSNTKFPEQNKNKFLIRFGVNHHEACFLPAEIPSHVSLTCVSMTQRPAGNCTDSFLHIAVFSSFIYTEVAKQRNK